MSRLFFHLTYLFTLESYPPSHYLFAIPVPYCALSTRTTRNARPVPYCALSTRTVTRPLIVL